MLPVFRVVLAMLAAFAGSLALMAPVGACERHLNGHQQSSDSQHEGINR